MKLIDADALGIGRANEDIFDCPEYAKGWNSAIDIIQTAPTVDAVPVVRCRDCIHFREDGYCKVLMGYCGNEDWFCASGRRK